jgi:hypothetical protein
MPKNFWHKIYLKEGDKMIRVMGNFTNKARKDKT